VLVNLSFSVMVVSVALCHGGLSGIPISRWQNSHYSFFR